MTTAARRVYPTWCTSAYCGKSGAGCTGCPNLPELDAFKEWVKESGAVVADPVWCPTVWTVPS